MTAPTPFEAQQPPNNSVVSFLRRLPGIRSAGVAEDESGNIAQVRLLCTSDREPRHLAHEVASLLRIWFNLEVSSEAVEVVQLLDEEQSRLRLIGFREWLEGPEAVVEVKLFDQDTEWVGVARGAKTRLATVRLAAEATALAINRRFENAALCWVEWADVIAAGSHKVASAVTRFEGQAYSGNSLVRGGNVGEAIARAVLSSLNRQLAWPHR